MLPPREEYALLKRDTLRLLRAVLSTHRKERLEDLFLVLADFPVEVIAPEDLELLADNIKYWLRGYAIPVTALRELGIKDIERRSTIILRGDEIAVEPDVNSEFARDFVSRVEGDLILDMASGFGWIPPLLSSKARVLAVDKAYLNRVIYGEDRIHIENTTIELFPDSSTARRYLMQVRRLRDYRDFAVFFWESHDAVMENILPLQGDACDLRRCLNLKTGKEYSVKDGSVDAVTCFFSFNHIPPWRSALKEAYRVLKDGGQTWTALYREHLQKFPVKFAYDWAEQLGIKIVEIKDFQEQAEDIGFHVSPVKKYRGAALYTLLRLEK